MPVLPLSSDYDGKSLRHYQVDKQTVVGYFFAVRLLRIMYCVHEPANVAGTWHSARYSAGTNLLPDRDILRAVMSRNKMVERKTELALVFLFYLRSSFLLLLFLLLLSPPRLFVRSFSLSLSLFLSFSLSLGCRRRAKAGADERKKPRKERRRTV